MTFFLVNIYSNDYIWAVVCKLACVGSGPEKCDPVKYEYLQVDPL